MKCTRCGSYAINHGSHDRDGSDPELCDVCYWRKRAETTWKPIETAPRDGTWVLLEGGQCHGEDGGGNDRRPVVAQWTNTLNNRSMEFGWWQFAWYDGGGYGTYGAPTHWMPLPEAQVCEKDQGDFAQSEKKWRARQELNL